MKALKIANKRQRTDRERGEKKRKRTAQTDKTRPMETEKEGEKVSNV